MWSSASSATIRPGGTTSWTPGSTSTIEGLVNAAGLSILNWESRVRVAKARLGREVVRERAGPDREAILGNVPTGS